MPPPKRPLIDDRREQMFPILEPVEIDRLRRFGELRAYRAGEALVKVGEVGHGLTVVLAGAVAVTRHDELDRREAIVTHGPGSFMGEVAQLSGRPALVDAHAEERVEALIIPPEKLRALLVAEAELGEEVMRALILRRVGLIEAGAGPVIIGHADDGDVLRLENYLGFPTGITGMALMGRAYNQAQKFGAEMAIPAEAANLRSDDAGAGERGFALCLSNDESVRARAVVVASGARYRRLHVRNLEAFESTSVHYWASPVEARLCAGQEVALVGAGNSAGQAVVALASQVAKVWLLVRGPNRDARMSRYLVDRIAGLPNVEVLLQTEVTGLEGHDGALAAIRWRRSGEEVRRPIRHLFLFIGADPYTDWLSGCDVALDDKGFVRTGPEVGVGRRPLETSRPGVFAIGDVRSGSVKRVAAAVGEGAQIVATLHAFLAEAGRAPVVAKP